jgi:hypothetical protein
MLDPFARHTDLGKGSVFRIFLGYSAVAFGSEFAASIFPPLSFASYLYVLCFAGNW